MPAAARRIWRSVEGRGSSVVVRCMDLAVFCKPEYDVRPAKARRILYGSQVIVTTQTALGVPNRGIMVGIDPLFLTTIAALPVGMISFALVRAARSSRRNREDRCGNCGGSLYALDAMVGPSLVQGHLVCGPCATKERRSLIR